MTKTFLTPLYRRPVNPVLLIFFGLIPAACSHKIATRRPGPLLLPQSFSSTIGLRA